MTDIALIILASLSLIGLILVLFLFLKLSQRFEDLKLDIATAFKDKNEYSVLSKNSEQDLLSIKENISSFTKQLQEYLNNTMGKIRDDTKKTSDLLENLNSIVDQKDKELVRFKNGYDLVRLRSFALNVVEAITFLQNRKSEFTDEKFVSYISAYEKQLERVLDDLGIQKYSPKLGELSTETEGIEVIGSTPLSENSKTNCISEIISNGFLINFQDGRKEILKSAQVNVYK